MNLLPPLVNKKQVRSVSSSGWSAFNHSDAWIALSLAVVFGGLAYLAAQQIHPFFYETRPDTWFQGDLSYRFSMVTDHTHKYTHNKLHPVFAPLGFVFTYFIRAISGISAIQSVWLLIASVAVLWVVALFALLRKLGCHALDAMVFTVLGAVSAASIFWMTVPETYPFGSLVFFLSFYLVLQSESHFVSPIWSFLISVFNIGITISNGMVAFLACIINYSWITTALILTTATLVVAAIAVLVILKVPVWVYVALTVATGIGVRYLMPRVGDRTTRLIHRLENNLSSHWRSTRKSLVWMGVFGAVVAIAGIIVLMAFPALRNYLGSEFMRRFRYCFTEAAGGPVAILRSFFAHTMVMPDIHLTISTWHPETHLLILLTQHAAAGSASLWGAIAVGLWMALLGLGTWAFLKSRQHPKLRFVLGLTLIGQLGLHLAYGEETFLYALHFLPLLLLLAAWSTLTRARAIALVLASLLIVTATVNNVHQFQVATKYLNTLAYTYPRVHLPSSGGSD